MRACTGKINPIPHPWHAVESRGGKRNAKNKFLLLLVSFLALFIYLKGRKRDTERDFPSVSSFPKGHNNQG